MNIALEFGTMKLDSSKEEVVFEQYKDILVKEGIIVVDVAPRSDQELLEFALLFGHVVPGARGEMVQNLPARQKGEGPIGSFSYSVGYESFPWHTDTAYWDRPARYLLLYSPVASPCATTYQSFEAIRTAIPDFDYLMERAVFLLDVPGKRHYLSPSIDGKGYRLDFHIYRPVNDEAFHLRKCVSEYLIKNHFRHVWSGKEVVIMDNWRFIHAREDAQNDKSRLLKRIYINELV